MAKIIQSLNMSFSVLPRAGENRSFAISGDKGASFMLQVANSSGEFYNFKTQAFSASFTSESNLKATLTSTKYNGRVLFPANGSGDTYNIMLFANPATDTTLSVKGDIINKQITQLADNVITFALVTANTATYTANPPSANLTSTGNPSKAYNINFATDWTVTNASSDAEGFGLRRIRQPVETDWVFRKTQTVDGAISLSLIHI